MKEIAEVSRIGFLDMQVCVPKAWNDYNVIFFAETENPCGTQNGWQIRKEGSPLLAGSPERCQCSDHEDNVHIMLDA